MNDQTPIKHAQTTPAKAWSFDTQKALALREQGVPRYKIAQKLDVGPTELGRFFHGLDRAKNAEIGDPAYWSAKGFDDACARMMAASALRPNFSTGGVFHEEKAFVRGKL